MPPPTTLAAPPPNPPLWCGLGFSSLWSRVQFTGANAKTGLGWRSAVAVKSRDRSENVAAIHRYSRQCQCIPRRSLNTPGQADTITRNRHLRGHGGEAMPTASRRTKPLGLFPGKLTPRLYDHLIGVLRVRHYSRRTEGAYVYWIRRYIQFHPHQHPRELGESDVNRFLTHLALKEHVAASTQNQALSAIVFLCEHALARKYPSANREWRWQFVFPRQARWRNPNTGDHLNRAGRGVHSAADSLARRER